MITIQDFIISKVRVKLLQIFFTSPQQPFYVRQLTRLAQEEINAIRRELLHLSEVGLLKSEKRGNRLYYFLNSSYLYYPELLAMVAKSTGLGRAIIKNKNKLGKIKFAMLSGRFVKKLPKKKDQVDLLLVGNIILPALSALVANYEKEVGREINYTVMTEEELTYRKTRKDPFINSILLQSRLMLIGSEEDLLT